MVLFVLSQEGLPGSNGARQVSLISLFGSNHITEYFGCRKNKWAFELILHQLLSRFGRSCVRLQLCVTQEPVQFHQEQKVLVNPKTPH